MPNKLFIGNLSFNVADEGLTEFFASMNVTVESIRVMRDAETGRSRGFAFVELPPDADMASIINQLNGKVLDGRPLTVNEARQQKPREFGGGAADSIAIATNLGGAAGEAASAETAMIFNARRSVPSLSGHFSDHLKIKTAIPVQMD